MAALGASMLEITVQYERRFLVPGYHELTGCITPIGLNT